MRVGLTLRGWVTLAGGAAWWLAAVLLREPELAWPGLFLVGLVGVSWLMLLPGRRRPVVREVAPALVEVGQPVHARLVLSPGGPRLGAVAGYRDDVSSGLGAAAAVTVPVGLGLHSHRVDQVYRPAWRGRHRVGPLRCVVGDAFGLARRTSRYRETTEVLALPAVLPLPELRTVAGVGSATETPVLRTSLVGPDDVLLREYRPGDDVRRIHWRATAHAGELMVRREEHAWDPSATILLDSRAASYPPARPSPALEWLVSAAASIGCHLLERGFSVSLTTAGDPSSATAAVEGSHDLLVRLALLETGSTSSLGGVLAASPAGSRGQLLVALLGALSLEDAVLLADARRSRSTCWAVLRAWEPPQQEARDVLAAAGWRLVVADGGVADAWRALAGEPS